MSLDNKALVDPPQKSTWLGNIRQRWSTSDSQSHATGASSRSQHVRRFSNIVKDVEILQVTAKSNKNTSVLKKSRAASVGIETVVGVQVDRPIITMVNLDESVTQTTPKKHIEDWKQQKLNKIKKSIMSTSSFRKSCFAKMTRYFPFIQMLKKYEFREYFAKDAISGISTGLLVIPQAIAYATLANLKPQNGFYSAFFAMLIYFFLGTSHHINMSSQGVISLLVGETVGKYASIACNVTTPGANRTLVPGVCIDPNLAVMTASAITLLAGLFQFAFGLLHLGIICVFLSDSLVSAFTCASALHIMISQLANIFGLRGVGRATGVANLYYNLKFIILKMYTYNGPTILVSVLSFVALIVGRILNPKIAKKTKILIPFDVVILIVAMIAAKYDDWDHKYHIESVGDIPRGFEIPTAPSSYIMVSTLTDAFTVAIISYAISISVGKTFAVKYGYEIDSNQEFIAHGVLNTVMSFFHGFVSTSSMVCSAMNDSMGGKTQIFSLFSTVIVLIGILGIGPFFSTAPKSTLSAIIMVNLLGMVLQATQLPFLWKTNKYDFLIWVVTFFAVVGLAVDLGLAVGVIFALATIIIRTQTSNAYILGRIPGTDVYRNIKRNKAAEEITGIKIYKFEGNIYFGSAESFRVKLYKKTKTNPKKIMARMESENAERIKLLKRKPVENLDPVAIGFDLDPVAIESANYNSIGMENSCMTLRRFQKKDSLIVKCESDKIEPEGGIMTVSNQESGNLKQVSTNQLAASVVSSTIKSANGLRYVILDMSACAFIDSVGIRLINQIYKDFKAIGIDIYMANIVTGVRRSLILSQFYQRHEQSHAFATIHDAVLAALQQLRADLLAERYGIFSTDNSRNFTDGSGTHANAVNSMSRKAASQSTKFMRKSDIETDDEIDTLRTTIRRLQLDNDYLRKRLDVKKLEHPSSSNNLEETAAIVHYPEDHPDNNLNHHDEIFNEGPPYHNASVKHRRKVSIMNFLKSVQEISGTSNIAGDIREFDTNPPDDEETGQSNFDIVKSFPHYRRQSSRPTAESFTDSFTGLREPSNAFQHNQGRQMSTVSLGQTNEAFLDDK